MWNNNNLCSTNKQGVTKPERINFRSDLPVPSIQRSLYVGFPGAHAIFVRYVNPPWTWPFICSFAELNIRDESWLRMNWYDIKRNLTFIQTMIHWVNPSPDAPCDPLMTMIDYRRNWSIFIFIRGLNEIATCRVLSFNGVSKGLELNGHFWLPNNISGIYYFNQ